MRDRDAGRGGGFRDPIDRRTFLRRSSALAVASAAGLGLGGLVGSLPGAEAGPSGSGRPRIAVVFVRPAQAPVVSWPGGNCDIPAQQALFAGTLRHAAEELGVDLAVREEPLYEAGEIAPWLEGFRASPPEGLIICAMELFGGWESTAKILAGRGEVPAIVYSNLSGFTGNMAAIGGAPRTFLAATQDVGWLATGLRLLSAIPRMRRTKVLLLAGSERAEAEAAEGTGTIFRIVPRSRFDEVYAEVGEDDEVRAIAREYLEGARKVVEPTAADVRAAARNYIACRRLLAAEGCQAISIDCLGWKNPVCLAFSRLLDEGIAAGCEADRHAAIGQLAASLVLGRPGFIQDPSPNTVNNTLIGSHCTSPTRLEGARSDYRAPFQIRDYHTRTGASLQVLWPEGKDVTVLEFLGPRKLAVVTGRVRSNIPQPPSGCCRTAVEIEIDGVTDSRDAVDSRTARGFHQVFVLGNHRRILKAWGDLAGIAIEPLCG